MSAWVPAVGFDQPLWLLLVPLVWVLYRWRRRPGGTPDGLQAYADARLLPWLVLTPGRSSAAWLGLLAWLLIVVALGGPVLLDRQTTERRAALDIAVILDISPSMRAGDVEPDRLQRARLELHDLLQRLRGDRVALIAFSAHAYPVLPLTDDLAAIPWYLDALEPGLTRLAGSNVVPALELAARTLDAAAGGGRAILLLSDGEFPDSAEALAAADRLARRGIPLFALGVGTASGAPVPAAGGFHRDGDGNLVVSRLDRELLSEIAARTGGGYADLRADGGGWESLLRGLSALARAERPSSAQPSGLPLWPWLLAGGLLLLIALRLRAPLPALPGLALAGLALLALSPIADASPSAERAAFEALSAGRLAEAEALYRDLDSFNGRLGAGAVAWRQARFGMARERFAEAERRAGNDTERAIAIYNQGNALARLGRLAEAMRAYDDALALHPNHARAALNRDIVGRVLGRATGDDPDATPRITPDADDVSPGDQRDRDASGEARAVEGDGGDRGSGRAQVIARPLPGGRQPMQAGGSAGESAQAALARIDAVEDHAAEVLRHRFMLMDADRPRVEESRPW